MIEVLSKKQLAVALSRLKGFEKPDFKLEQYQTESEIGAEIIWNIACRREIQGKTAADLGCGTGLLGIGLLLAGADKVYFVDIDDNAIETAKKNLEFIENEFDIELKDKAVFVVDKVENFNKKVEIVIENPPFGIQGKSHSDKEFLGKAMQISKLVYSFHKAESKGFINAFSRDNGFKTEGYWEFDWPLKQTMKYHTKKIHYFKVGCWRLVKA